jgi:hypothetical protein
MCSCRKNKGKRYVWTSQDGQRTKTYTDRMQARARVIHEETKEGKGNGGSVVEV